MIPVKAVYTGADVTALGEFATGDTIPVAHGGTGATDAGGARTSLGLGNVDNTSDLNKPVSTAQQTALNLKQATLVSGTNIKTLNGASILGTGDIVVSGGGAGATGGGSDQAFVENDTLITADYTIGQGGLTDCTISIATPCNITVANDWVADQMVWFTTTGALPTGLSTSVAYYVLAAGLTTSNVRLSLTAGGAAINTSGTQSGTHKIAKCKNASIAGQFGTASGVTVTIPPGCTLVNT